MSDLERFHFAIEGLGLERAGIDRRYPQIIQVSVGVTFRIGTVGENGAYSTSGCSQPSFVLDNTISRARHCDRTLGEPMEITYYTHSFRMGGDEVSVQVSFFQRLLHERFKDATSARHASCNGVIQESGPASDRVRALLA